MFPTPSRRCFNLTRCAVAFTLIVWTSALQAAPITFTLNDYTSTGNPREFQGAIPGGYVLVKDANYSKYDGEGYVIGLNGSTSSHTLADLNGDKKFLNTFGSTSFTVEFPYQIYSVQFDYEIFPAASSSTNWPDFTFKADGNFVFRTLAEVPPSGSHSPNSGASRAETEPQFIGNSGLWVFSSGVTFLEFIDWPPTIGMANLQFSANPPTTSNPPTIASPPAIQDSHAIPEASAWLIGALMLASVGACSWSRGRRTMARFTVLSV